MDHRQSLRSLARRPAQPQAKATQCIETQCIETQCIETQCVELTDEQLDQASGALVVPAIIAVLISPLLPSVQKDGMSPDQARQVAAGNPMPRPR